MIYCISIWNVETSTHVTTESWKPRRKLGKSVVKPWFYHRFTTQITKLCRNLAGTVCPCSPPWYMISIIISSRETGATNPSSSKKTKVPLAVNGHLMPKCEKQVLNHHIIFGHNFTPSPIFHQSYYTFDKQSPWYNVKYSKIVVRKTEQFPPFWEEGAQQKTWKISYLFSFLATPILSQPILVFKKKGFKRWKLEW